MPEINKILYATDLSENARFAFSYAADLADRYDARISILYVMEEMNHTMESVVMDMVGDEKWAQLKAEKNDYLTGKIKSRLEGFCRDMEAQMDSCRFLVEDIIIKKGNPTEEILDLSKAMGADMIVLGSHGYNILRDSLIGGTARRVVRQSKTPVLVVRLPE